MTDRRTHGRLRHGWLIHGLGADGVASIEHAELALDEEFAGFCSERLTEEVLAATLRRQRLDPDDPAVRRAEAGLRLLDELLGGLERGVLPHDATLDLLTMAYRSHPDFQERWRDPRGLLRPSSQSTPAPVSGGC